LLTTIGSRTIATTVLTLSVVTGISASSESAEGKKFKPCKKQVNLQIKPVKMKARIS
jgi:hypothetical protein